MSCSIVNYISTISFSNNKIFWKQYQQTISIKFNAKFRGPERTWAWSILIKVRINLIRWNSWTFLWWTDYQKFSFNLTIIAIIRHVIYSNFNSSLSFLKKLHIKMKIKYKVKVYVTRNSKELKEITIA